MSRVPLQTLGESPSQTFRLLLPPLWSPIARRVPPNRPPLPGNDIPTTEFRRLTSPRRTPFPRRRMSPYMSTSLTLSFAIPEPTVPSFWKRTPNSPPRLPVGTFTFALPILISYALLPLSINIRISLSLGAHPKVPDTTPPSTELTPLPLNYIPRQWKPSLHAKPTRPIAVHGWNVPNALLTHAPSLHLETHSLEEQMLVCLKPTRPAASCNKVPMPCNVAPAPVTLLPSSRLPLCSLLKGVPTRASGA